MCINWSTRFLPPILRNGPNKKDSEGYLLPNPLSKYDYRGKKRYNQHIKDGFSGLTLTSNKSPWLGGSQGQISVPLMAGTVIKWNSQKEFGYDYVSTPV